MEETKSLPERLDQLRHIMESVEFLTGEGLSNEVNIRVFCYDGKEEMAVRRFIRQIEEMRGLACRPQIVPLYRQFLTLCDHMGILDAAEEMEQEEGSAYLLTQLQFAVTATDMAESIAAAPHGDKNLLLLTEVGEVYPFLRVHQLLESLQPLYPDVPILVMYPGTFNGRQLRLFNKMTPSDYYRAFTIV